MDLSSPLTTLPTTVRSPHGEFNRTSLKRHAQRAIIVMLGFDRAIPAFVECNMIKYDHSDMSDAWVYIMTNKPNGTLYVGVTGDLPRRIWEHREGVADGFTKKYGLKRLVYVESHDGIQAAIQREKNLKHWSRTWKVRLILDSNPNWHDLYDNLA